MPAILELQRLRQEGWEVKAIPGYQASLRAGGYIRKFVSKKIKQKRNHNTLEKDNPTPVNP